MAEDRVVHLSLASKDMFMSAKALIVSSAAIYQITNVILLFSVIIQLETLIVDQVSVRMVGLAATVTHSNVSVPMDSVEHVVNKVSY